MIRVICRLPLLLLLLTSGSVSAGLYERIQNDDLGWLPAMPFVPPLEYDWAELLKSPPARAAYFNPQLEPVLLLRTFYVTTFEDRYVLKAGTEQETVVDSTRAAPSPFGHREGFVLDSVEVGLRGRFNPLGIYYQLKAELVPREKDGNRSSDYLKDAYLGWDYYSVADVRVGRMKVPLSPANMTSTERRHFIYAPILDTLTPKRQLGAMVHLSDPFKALRLRGGVFNSTGLASEQTKDTDQLLYVGRIDLDPAALLRALNIRWLDLETNFGFNIANVSENYDIRARHRWLGFDARLHLMLVTLEGEYLIRDFLTEPDQNGRQESYRGYGWHADAIVHAWPGVIDLLLRVEQMDGEQELVRGFNTALPIDDVLPQKKRWYTAGVNLLLTDKARFSFNYTVRQELEGYSLDNDLFLWMVQYSL